MVVTLLVQSSPVNAESRNLEEAPQPNGIIIKQVALDNRQRDVANRDGLISMKSQFIRRVLPLHPHPHPHPCLRRRSLDDIGRYLPASRAADWLHGSLDLQHRD